MLLQRHSGYQSSITDASIVWPDLYILRLRIRASAEGKSVGLLFPKPMHVTSRDHAIGLACPRPQ